jgi:adenylate cyclase
VLATDITGYVALSERWRAREGELAALVADYRALVHEVVERHGGTVLDFAGDASMSLWDAPAPDPLARARAVAAAVELVRALDRFGAERGLDPAHATRAGLAEGRLVLGNIASGEDRFTFGAVGEALNVAARLEQLNKALGTRVLATAGVVEGLPPGGPRLAPMGPVRLRGRSLAEEVVAIEVA